MFSDTVVSVVKACLVVENPNPEGNVVIDVIYRGCSEYPMYV